MAKKTDGVAVDKLVKLHEALLEQHAKTHDLLREVGQILSGQPGIGQILKRLETTFSSLWQVRHGSPYAWHYVKDRAQMKRLIKLLGADELEARMTAYLRDGSPYVVDARHPFAIFVASVNRYPGRAAADLTLDAPAIDCQHRPPCQSDQEHTHRRNAELRA